MQPKINIEDVKFPQAPFNLLDNSILIGNRGSVAHGTWIENTNPNSIDDIDLMCVTIPPLKYYFGLDKWEMCEGIDDPWDIISYELKKFMGLLVKQNPNVLMMLWLDKEDYYKITPLGQLLIDERNMFSTREAAKTFIGYAQGQLNRMTHVAGRGYLGAKRKQIVEKYGFDVKNAGHLIRLLHMGIEFLETGILNVKRTWDRELLMDIKTGKYSLVQVNQMAADGFEKIRELEKHSPLPKRLDLKKINELCMDLLHIWFMPDND